MTFVFVRFRGLVGDLVGEHAGVSRQAITYAWLSLILRSVVMVAYFHTFKERHYSFFLHL